MHPKHGGRFLQDYNDGLRWVVDFQHRHRKYGRAVKFTNSRLFRSPEARRAYEATHAD